MNLTWAPSPEVDSGSHLEDGIYVATPNGHLRGNVTCSGTDFAHFTSSSVDSVNLAITNHGKIPIPRNIREALDDPIYGAQWQAACNLEVRNKVINNGAWSEVESIPAGRRVLKGKWVFKIVYNDDGTLKALKPRWVACGYGQIPGLDFHETHASTLPIASARLFFAAAAGQNWHVEEIDGVKAFAQGDFADNETVYVEHPHFVAPTNPTAVGCLLRRPLEAPDRLHTSGRRLSALTSRRH